MTRLNHFRRMSSFMFLFQAMIHTSSSENEALLKDDSFTESNNRQNTGELSSRNYRSVQEQLKITRVPLDLFKDGDYKTSPGPFKIPLLATSTQTTKNVSPVGDSSTNKQSGHTTKGFPSTTDHTTGPDQFSFEVTSTVVPTTGDTSIPMQLQHSTKDVLPITGDTTTRGAKDASEVVSPTGDTSIPMQFQHSTKDVLPITGDTTTRGTVDASEVVSPTGDTSIPMQFQDSTMGVLPITGDTTTRGAEDASEVVSPSYVSTTQSQFEIASKDVPPDVTTSRSQNEDQPLESGSSSPRTTALIFVRSTMNKVISSDKPDDIWSTSSTNQADVTTSPGIPSSSKAFNQSLYIQDGETDVQSSNEPLTESTSKPPPLSSTDSTDGLKIDRRLKLQVSVPNLIDSNVTPVISPLFPSVDTLPAKSITPVQKNDRNVQKTTKGTRTHNEFKNTMNISEDTIRVPLSIVNTSERAEAINRSEGHELLDTLNSITGCSYDVLCDNVTVGDRIPCCYDCHQVSEVKTDGLKCCNGLQPSLVIETIFINIDQGGTYSEWTKCRHPLEYHHVNDHWSVVADAASFPSFRMVSGCPATYVDASIRLRCERETSFTDLRIVLETPIVDTGEGVIYKNVFCLLCHGQHFTSNFKPLSLVLSVNDLKCDYNTLSSIYTTDDLLDWSLLDVDRILPSSLELTIKATLDSTPFPLYEILTCGTPSYVDSDSIDCVGHNSTLNTLLKETCSQYELSIIASTKGSPSRRYSNAACAVCDLGPHAQINPFPGCKRSDSGKVTFKINVLPALKQFAAAMEGKSGSSTQNHTLQDNTSAGCRNISEANQDACRHVFCPRRHYSVPSGCEPLLLGLTNQVFYVKFTVVRGSRPSEEDCKSIFDQISEYIESLAFTFLVRARMSVYRDDERGNLLTELWILPPRQQTYDEIKRLLYPLIIPIAKQGTLQSADGVYLRIESGDGESLSCYEGIGINRRKVLFNFFCVQCRARHDFGFIRFAKVTITKQDYCMRVALEPHEFTRGNGYIHVHVSDKILGDYELNWLTNSSVIVCVDDLRASMSTNTVKPTSSWSSPKSFTETTTFKLFSMLIGLILISFILRMVITHLPSFKSK